MGSAATHILPQNGDCLNLIDFTEPLCQSHHQQSLISSRDHLSSICSFLLYDELMVLSAACKYLYDHMSSKSTDLWNRFSIRTRSALEMSPRHNRKFMRLLQNPILRLQDELIHAGIASADTDYFYLIADRVLVHHKSSDRWSVISSNNQIQLMQLSIDPTTILVDDICIIDTKSGVVIHDLLQTQFKVPPILFYDSKHGTSLCQTTRGEMEIVPRAPVLGKQMLKYRMISGQISLLAGPYLVSFYLGGPTTSIFYNSDGFRCHFSNLEYRVWRTAESEQHDFGTNRLGMQKFLHPVFYSLTVTENWFAVIPAAIDTVYRDYFIELYMPSWNNRDMYKIKIIPPLGSVSYWPLRNSLHDHRDLLLCVVAFRDKLKNVGYEFTVYRIIYVKHLIEEMFLHRYVVIPQPLTTVIPTVDIRFNTWHTILKCTYPDGHTYVDIRSTSRLKN